MTDVNHQVSKALVDRYGKNTLFVLEDLTGMRTATEKVRKRNRYEIVSWAFYQLHALGISHFLYSHEGVRERRKGLKLPSKGL